MKKFNDINVKAVFDSLDPAIRKHLLELRELIFEVGANTEGVGPLEETLKWREPAYLTTKSKSGTTIRLYFVRGSTDRFAIYFNCKTTLLESFRQLYPDVFEFGGNRALIFQVGQPLPVEPLSHCIALALTYRLKS